jgi:hypothetical protein
MTLWVGVPVSRRPAAGPALPGRSGSELIVLVKLQVFQRHDREYGQPVRRINHRRLGMQQIEPTGLDQSIHY